MTPVTSQPALNRRADLRPAFVHAVLLALAALLLSACSSIPLGVEKPNVKVTGLELLPARGMEQRLAVHLGITNPNGRDLSVRGISYNIGIENIDVLSGVTSQVPTLKAYEETPVTVEVSANLLSIARLVQHFSQRGVTDQVNYNFDAKLDFSQWLPAMRVQEEGQIRLQY
ncbi:LEA type 2 family protein [Marinimicrobium sp. ARAG 43.8]|uniref:LEA type 2 family protein n=1 Tax=Marinimicrobium sp. ARAG 43.8 TaxID=3418719 RepID=UPI003CEBFAEB